MIYVGIDIGSTCAKTAVMNENKEIKDTFVIPTGWSSLEAVERINETLSSRGVNPNEATCISTGYGRKAGDGNYLSCQRCQPVIS